MKIAVLNGSPKGQVSVTMNYMHYLEKRFPAHQFIYLDIAQKIKHLEKDEGAFGKYLEVIKTSAGVFWAFPLYVCLVASQYKRFIELIFERDLTSWFWPTDMTPRPTWVG